MIKNISKTLSVIAMLAMIFGTAHASEVTGTLSSGIATTSGDLNATVNPPAAQTPPIGGGGGGGGSGPSVSFSLLKGDMNNDGRVGILDFVGLMANWGKTGSGNIADLNGDSRVDILDFVLLMANWTK